MRENYVESVKAKINSSQTELSQNNNSESLSFWATVYKDNLYNLYTLDYAPIFKFKQYAKNNDLFPIKIQKDTNRLDNLSFDIFGSPYLWWVIKLLNPDICRTPFTVLKQGTIIYVVSYDRAIQILNQIKAEYETI